MTRAVTDGKTDRFPSRNRPALVLQQMHAAAMHLLHERLLEVHVWLVACGW